MWPPDEPKPDGGKPQKRKPHKSAPHLPEPQEPKPRRARKLRDEEVAVWVEVARSVKARKGATLPPREAKPVAPAALAKAPRKAAAVAPAPIPRHAPPLAPLERKLKRDLHRGKADIGGAIDLHGMTQAQAHGALRGFLARSQAMGAKLVIVITGKGWSGARETRGHWMDEPGVLRRAAPHWLREPDMRDIVLGFEEAAPGHGGAGALYVRLRRRGRP